MTSLIDFAQLSTDIMPLIAGAVGAAVLIGGSVLAARLGWRFFRSFGKG